MVNIDDKKDYTVVEERRRRYVLMYALFLSRIAEKSDQKLNLEEKKNKIYFTQLKHYLSYVLIVCRLFPPL